MAVTAQRRRQRGGFTLVEILIVVAIISLLAAIIYPAYFNARERSITSTCLNNLRMITSAKEQYALENMNNLPTLPELVPTYLQNMPECPAGGGYLIGGADADATCGVTGHSL